MLKEDGTFYWPPGHIKALRDEHKISPSDAQRIAREADLQEAIDEAHSLYELKPILRWLAKACA